MYDWHQYNEKQVRRSEILISDDVLQNWDKELAAMNRKKEGRRFLFPESFMKIVGYGIGVILLNFGMYFVAPAIIIIKLRSHRRC